MPKTLKKLQLQDHAVDAGDTKYIGSKRAEHNEFRKRLIRAHNRKGTGCE